jgi:4-phospho-D-threonate 3-dehydrogenase / 4-phospho-D-erythronate 3-dehydrogenase
MRRFPFRQEGIAVNPTNPKPKIVVTIGDPSGIGPEVVLKALSSVGIEDVAEWVVVGDRVALEKSAASCGVEPASMKAAILDVKALKSPQHVEFGKLSPDCGQAAVEYVRVATRMCLEGEAHGLVTAPLNKEAVSQSGIPFTGHTEYIAELCGATEPRMLLSSPKLHVIHVTTHMALRRAIESTAKRILQTIELGNEAMKWLGYEQPRIATCGLNPHAGEHGLFGDEELEHSLPAIEAAKRKGIHVDGPHAADTIFLQASRGAYDLVVAMYHDQGHIAMKLIDFENTVNVSLGMPIVRTSVDHGTAFDIAGKNRANPSHMIAALRTGAALAARFRERPRSTS